MQPSLDGADEGGLLELVARAREGDGEAWREITRRFGPMVLALGRRARLSQDEREELLQRTWLALVERLELLRRPQALPAWIAGTARRQALVLRRERRGGDPEAEPSAETLALERTDPAELLAELELQALVRAELAALSERCSRLLERLFDGGPARDYDRIALELGMPRGSLGPTRRRCLAALAERLERRGLGPEDGGERAPGCIHAPARDTEE